MGKVWNFNKFWPVVVVAVTAFLYHLIVTLHAQWLCDRC